MTRRYSTTYRSASRDAARGEAKRAAAESACIPVRGGEDQRTAIEIDLSWVGGVRLVIEPRRGHMLQWRARDDATGSVLYGGALKSVLHAIADALPRAQLMDD